MEDDRKSTLIRFGTTFLIASIVLVCFFAIKGFFTDDAKENIQVLVDSFFSTGIIFIMVHGLIFVSGEGAFWGIGYALTFAFKALVPFSKKTHETYADYRARKAEKATKNKDKCILIVGLLFLIVSLIFLAIWYKI